MLAQQPELSFKHIAAGNGIAGTEIFQSIMDRKGFIWFATNKGITRYDGSSFENYSLSELLKDNSIIKIQEDDSGKIWMMSWSGKLAYYYNNKVNAYKYNDSIIKAFKGSWVCNFFYVCPDNVIIIGSYRNGYFEINGKGQVKQYVSEKLTGKLEINNKYKRLTATSAYTKNDTAVYISSDGALKIPLALAANADHIKIVKRKNGNIVLGHNHIYEIENNKIHISDTTYRSTCITEDDEGELWAGTVKGGAFRLGKKIDNNVRQNVLSGLTVTSIVKDFEGGLWFTTLENGIYYLRNKNVTLIKPVNAINISCYALAKDTLRKIIYAGFDNGSLLQINNNSFSTVKMDFSNPGHYSELMFDHQSDKLYFSASLVTGYFLNLFLNKKSPIKIITSGGGAKHIVMNDHSLYLGFPNGLVRIQNNITELFNNKSAFRAGVVYPVQNDSIVVGNLGGVWLIKNTDTQPEKMFKDDSVLSGRISFIDKYDNNYWCFAVKGYGLYFKSNDNNFLIGINEGLQSTEINAVYKSGKTYWLGTNEGIVKISGVNLKEKKCTIQTYSINEGLSTNEIAKLILQDSIMYCATKMGLMIANPLKLQAHRTPPRLYVTNIKINGRDTLLGKEFKELEYNQNNIYIRFTGIAYANNNIQYQYKVIGEKFDTGWVSVSTNELQFLGLSPGNYAIKLRSKVNNGNWNTIPETIKISILPPVWDTWQAYVLYIAFVILLVWAIIQRTIRKINEKHSSEIKMLNLESKALRAQMNPHFMFNALNSIQAFISSNESDQATYYLAKFSKLMRMILDNSKVQLITLEQEIQVLRTYIDLEKMRFDNKFDYAINDNTLIASSQILLPPMLLQPFVENAILHGFSSIDYAGQLTIVFTVEKDVLICSIDDNGKGRKEAGKIRKSGHTSSGVSITEERLKSGLKKDDKTVKITYKDKLNDNGTPAGTQVLIKIALLINQ